MKSEDKNTEIDAGKIFNLVVGNEKFVELQELLSAFNPFKVLGLTNYEIRHSNMIAWLFDSKASHAFDDLILKTFFFEVCSASEIPVLKEEELPKIYKAGFDDAVVIREQSIPDGFIDLLIVAKESKVVIIIENKFRAKESVGQLDRYLEWVKDEYNGYNIVPVYLTILGEEPSDSRYAIFSYEKLIQITESALVIKSGRLPDEVKLFVNHYLELLKEELGMNEELKKLCKSIYQNHREVIDKIYEVGNDYNFDDPANEFEKLKLGNNSKLKKRGRLYSFVDEEMAMTGAKLDAGWNCSDYAVSFWFYLNPTKNKLTLTLEVGPFNNKEKRKEFLTLLNNKDGIKVTVKKDGGTYSRIESKVITFNDWDVPDDISNTMVSMYDGFDKTKSKLVEAMKEFDWTGA